MKEVERSSFCWFWRERVTLRVIFSVQADLGAEGFGGCLIWRETSAALERGERESGRERGEEEIG